MLRKLLHGGHADEAPAETAIDTGALILKLVAMPVIFGIIMICAYIPFRLKKSPRLDQTRLLSYSNCVSGGIFLGFAFLHILPDAVNDFAEFSSDAAALPIIYFICMLGFFSVLAVEKILYTKVLRGDVESGYSFQLDAPAAPACPAVPQGNMEGCMAACNCDATAVSPAPAASEGGQDIPLQLKSSTSSPSVTNTAASGLHEGHFHTHDVPFKTNKRTTPYIIAMSLCFHSIFEGLALGLQPTLDSTITIFVGIAIHKCAEAFAMSVAFVKNDTPRRHWIPLLLVFGLVVPVGIAIGLGLTQVGDLQNLFSSVLGAFAAGSFLYVVLLGILVEEFSGFSRLWTKFLLVMAGLVFMAILSLSAPFTWEVELDLSLGHHLPLYSAI